MVSPIDKGGGAIQAPGTVSGGGVFQAAAAGGSITYSSADSFGEGAQGAASGSQYIATRGVGGWATANITTPLLSGSYGSEPDGVPYQLFADDLGFALLSNGERCRGAAGGGCPVANPPLPGSGAPTGYRDYYRRSASGSFESLLTAADLSHTSLGPAEFELRFVAATPDLTHVVLSSCAALTANAIEVSASGGCDPEAQNLYESSGGTLSLLNLLPNEVTGTPGARIAASSGAISADGSRVYFSSEGKVCLREGGVTKLVSEAPGASFEAASTDGSTAYVIDAGNLERYSAATDTLTPLTSGGGVEGVLGASADGSKVYYAKLGAVFGRSGAITSEVASSAIASNWPAPTGTARVSADGSHLLFVSRAELTGYPNEGAAEVFLYAPPPGGSAALLSCVSCNPSGEHPQGSASVPGARRNGSGEGALGLYKPRALAADGNRVFFETSDRLVQQDTNGRTDVYEWEAAGEGSCVRAGGCAQLISGGRDSEPSYFLDADDGGSEAFFLTAGALVPRDPGTYDVYVAREGGGFPPPQVPAPCIADACQILPEAPEDPTPGTLVPNSGNPALKVEGGAGKTKKGHKKPQGHRHGQGKKRIRSKGWGR
jgi:WD40-like Beta Propeller Repeat